MRPVCHQTKRIEIARDSDTRFGAIILRETRHVPYPVSTWQRIGWVKHGAPQLYLFEVTRSLVQNSRDSALELHNKRGAGNRSAKDMCR